MNSLFPYMHWAQKESFRSPYSLAQSGMPPPPTSVLGPLDRYLEPPAPDPLGALTTRLGELFGVESDRVLITLGASGALHLIALALFRSPARLLTEAPCSEPFRALPRLLGIEPCVVRRKRDAAWSLDPAEFAANAGNAGTQTTHILVSNPHAPTGVASDAGTLRELADAADRTGGTLISSEESMECARPDERVHAFQVAPNTLSIGTLTHAYGLGPLRIGWIIAGEGRRELIRQMHDLGFLVHVDPPTASLQAARAALDQLPALLQPLRQLEHDCKPLLLDWLSRSRQVDGVAPDLGLTAFPRVRDIADTKALSRYLQSDFGVDVVPGEYFDAPGHVRVGFGVPRATLEEGLQRLDRGIAAFRDRELP